MAQVECSTCGAPVEAAEAGRKDGRVVFHLRYTCDCRLRLSREAAARDAFRQGYERSQPQIKSERINWSFLFEGLDTAAEVYAPCLVCEEFLGYSPPTCEHARRVLSPAELALLRGNTQP